MNARMHTEEIVACLEGLEGWRLDGGKLTREFVFVDFVEAIGFMMRTAIWAERLDHHPEWRNVYRTVTVELVTHDVGGISKLDVELAAKMNELAASAQ
jgi:4a-hydroxytetrahydrobiopterin dehydratase